MQNTIRQYLEGVANSTSRRFLQLILDALGDRYSSVTLQNPGMVISSGGATTAKIGSTSLVYISRGIPVAIAGSTTLPVLTINSVGYAIGAGSFGIVGFYGDAAGNLYAGFGIPGATLAKATFPTVAMTSPTTATTIALDGLACLGYLIITYATAFTGGTTPLDTATTIYCAPDGAFDPTVLVK